MIFEMHFFFFYWKSKGLKKNNEWSFVADSSCDEKDKCGSKSIQ